LRYFNYSRPLTLVLLGAYFVAGYELGGPKLGASAIILPLVGLPCIWWPDMMAEGRGRRSIELPPSMVWFLGWVVFLLPVCLAVVLWLVGVRQSDL
jgi:hypothetical protein